MTHGFNPHTTQAKLSLQSVILNQALSYVSKYPYYTTEFTAPLEAVTTAVESAYILTPKDELPKVTAGYGGTFDVDDFGILYPQGSRTAESARKRAAAWLAIAQHLEAEEKAKAYEEAKAKAVADAAANAAESARQKRLDLLADEWFGKDSYSDLSANKASAVKEIYRLETMLAQNGEAA